MDQPSVNAAYGSQDSAAQPMTGVALETEATRPQSRSTNSLLRQGLLNPMWGFRTARSVLQARWDLRYCELGDGARLDGRCYVGRWGGRIRIGKRLLMYGRTVRCELTTHADGEINIGDGVFVNYGVSISAHRMVRIGDGCRVGQYTIIMDCDFHTHGGGDDHGESRPVIIGDRVWLGARVIVLKGVTIGDGASIAAGSIVTRDIPAGTVAAGAPAGVVRRRG